MQFLWRTFDELTPHELYDLLRARAEVFIVEQNCPYLDPDGSDYVAHHLLMRDETGELAGVIRLLPPGEHYDEPSIGRVLTLTNFRRTGAGKLLVQEGIRKSEELYPGQGNRIGAQSYLIGFYSGLGYKAVGEDYMLDGIPHREMHL
jgi:ElaA protein